MKLYGIYVYGKDGKKVSLLSVDKDLSSWGYFKRGSVGEVMDFFANTLVERTTLGTRQSINEAEYVGHVHARHDGLACSIISDQEYPERVCFSLMSKVIDEFLKAHPKDSWGSSPSPASLPFPQLKELLAKYQNPKEADSLSRVQADLDETKDVLHGALESLLDRGEKLDDLVSKSDQLSSSSKMFYRQAKKTNSCCVIS